MQYKIIDNELGMSELLLLDKNTPKNKDQEIEKIIIPRHPQSVLDLHQEYLKEAILKTQETIQQAKHRKLVYIRIITGKGTHSPNQKAILFPEIGNLLNQYKKNQIIQKIIARDGYFDILL